MRYCTEPIECGPGYRTVLSYRSASRGVLFGVIVSQHFGGDKSHCDDWFNDITIVCDAWSVDILLLK